MKHYLLSLLFLLTACSLNIEVQPSFSVKRSVFGDYTSNIYDDWAANRGLRLTSNASLNKWIGLTNSLILTHTGTTNLPSVPSGGVLATTSMGFNTDITHPITGAFTFCWYGRKQTATNAEVTIFDTNTAAPRAKVMLRISSAINHIGISYNGVIKDTGVQFPYDANFHTIFVRCDGTNAAVFLDGSQIGSTFTVTGGGLNTTQKLFILTSSTGLGLFGETKRIRIYKESLSDSLISVVNSGDFVQHIVDTGNSRLLGFFGQSNNGENASFTRADYPTVLQGQLDDPWLWDYVANDPGSNSFIPIPANVSAFFTNSSYPIACGPFLNAGYTIKQNYPNDHVFILETYKGGTNLYADWAPGTPTGLRAVSIGRMQTALATLIAEERTLVSINFIWIQGENDCNTTMQPSYLSNLNLLDSDMRAVCGSDMRFIEVYLSSQCISRTTQVGNDIFANQMTFVSQDTVHRFGVVTDSFQMMTYPVHYTPTGYCSIGAAIAPLTY